VVIAVLAVALGARTVAGGAGDGGGDIAGGSHGTSVVTRVVDGDTAVLDKLGKSRFIGVDTPEVYGGEQCFGAQASAFTKRTLDGRRIRYEVGTEPRDRYGRVLVYIWLEDGRFFNQMLVDRGYARPLAIAPNVERSEVFRRSATASRNAGRGLWETC
jgi:micrococcal nuclease